MQPEVYIWKTQHGCFFRGGWYDRLYTQEQLAQLPGVSRQAISKWESGAAYPEIGKLIRMSELSSCSLDCLLKGEAEPENAPTARSARF